EVIELDQDLHLLAGGRADHDGILAPALERWWQRAVARQDEEVAQVDVHGVGPAAARLEGPDLRLAALGRGVYAVLVEELAVDDPRPVRALELESALHLDPGEQLRRALGHREERRRHPARVGRVAVHDELEDRGPRRDEVTRLAPVVLLETVHQEDLVLERAGG